MSSRRCIGPFALRSQTEANRGTVARFLARRQAWFFFPFLLIQGFGLHITGVQSILRRRGRSAWVEMVLLTVHAVLYVSAVLWVLSPAKAIAFLCVQQGVFGLSFGCIFAPNQEGMPMIAADAHRRVRPTSDHHGEEHHRRPAHHLDVRRTQLPDRTPPFPHHAPVQPGEGAADRPDLLRSP